MIENIKSEPETLESASLSFRQYRKYALHITAIVLGLFSISLTTFAFASQNLSLFSRAASSVQSFPMRIGDKGVVTCLDGKISMSWSSILSRKSINIACVTDKNNPVATVVPTMTAMPSASTMPSMMPMPSGTSVPNGTSTSGAGFGIGNNDGLAVGIKLSAFNQIKADAVKGMYDRPCTAAEHDKTQWHSLVNVEKKCHYDHEHGDDPNYVNDLFGQPGSWFNQSGQSISYPWQSFNLPATTTAQQALTMTGTQGQKENDLKHQGYYWVVRRNQTCDGGQWCITDSRLQFHFMSSHHNEVGARFHTFSFEGRLCKNPSDPSTCGTYATAGWNDHGQLLTAALGKDCWIELNAKREGKPSTGNVISLPSDTQYYPLDFDGLVDELRCHKPVPSTVVKEYPNGYLSSDAGEWWTHGASDFRYVIKVFDPISNIDPASPSSPTAVNAPFCAQGDTTCRWNNTLITASQGYTTQLYKDYEGTPADGNGDGRTDVTLGRVYMNRFGDRNRNCSTPGLDCIPLIINNVPLSDSGDNQRYTAKECTSCTILDHELTPPGRASWIDWFYKM